MSNWWHVYRLHLIYCLDFGGDTMRTLGLLQKLCIVSLGTFKASTELVCFEYWAIKT